MITFESRFLYLSNPSLFSDDLADVEGLLLVVHRIQMLNDNFFG